jgi:hypothetical protein
MRYIIVLFILLAQSHSQNIIRGTVTDVSGTGIENAEILLINSANTLTLRTYTDSRGNWIISNIPNDTYHLNVKLDGFKPFTKKFLNLYGSDTTEVNITLSRDAYSIEEIDVVSQRFRQAQNDTRTSVLNLSPKTTRVIPGVGEDVLRSIQTLPGVSAPNDFSSQLVVRGSGPDQNLIIMDNIEIFNPYRLYGVFSMFNPETLDDISLITGGFPAKYGDRLSAVLDVTNKEGNRLKYFTGQTNVNISNANLVFSGKLPVKDIKGSWILSSRRSYYDLILGPFAKSAGLIDESASFPSFQDIQGKITLGPFGNHKFIFNGIYSRDAVNIIPGKSKELQDSITVRDNTRNDVLGMSWQYAPGKSFLTRTTFSWYRNSGDAEFGGELLDPVLNREQYTPELRDSLKALGLYLGIGFRSNYTFRKYSFQNNTFFISKRHKTEIGAGLDILKTDLNFTIELDERLKSIIQGNPNFNALTEGFLEGKNYYRFNVYAQDRIKLSKKLYFQPGLRFDYFAIIKKPYLSPRVSMSYIIDNLTTIRAASGLYFQSPGYEKLIDAQIFFDLTEEKASRLDAEKSAHFILGVERWLNDFTLTRFEVYYKKFSDLVVQERLTAYRYRFYLSDPGNTDPEYIRNPANWIRSDIKYPFDSVTSTPVNGAGGYAYGFEIFTELRNTRPEQKLSGWISYSYSVAQRQRNGLTIPFRYDSRHTLNLVANYRILKWLELGARFNLSSNFPITKPVGVKPRIVGDSLAVLPVINQVQFDLDFGDLSNVFSQRKPLYHRLDFRATAYTRFWNVDWAFYLDVINIYNRKNVIGFDYYIDENLKVREKSIGQFPLLPTLGINARF